MLELKDSVYLLCEGLIEIENIDKNGSLHDLNIRTQQSMCNKIKSSYDLMLHIKDVKP